MQTLEFKQGDHVTFNAYGQKIAAKVIEVGVTGHMFSPDDRVYYQLEGTGKTSLVSITTGLSIMESKYFKEPA